MFLLSIGVGSLKVGLIFTARILPALYFRNFFQDQGKCPQAIREEWHLATVCTALRQAMLHPR